MINITELQGVRRRPQVPAIRSLTPSFTQATHSNLTVTTCYNIACIEVKNVVVWKWDSIEHEKVFWKSKKESFCVKWGNKNCSKVQSTLYKTKLPPASLLYSCISKLCFDFILLIGKKLVQNEGPNLWKLLKKPCRIECILLISSKIKLFKVLLTPKKQLLHFCLQSCFLLPSYW